MTSPLIVWFRQDLRLKDNQAFFQAAILEKPLIALYINDLSDPNPLGQSGRWWLYHSLKSLEKSLQRYGIPLIIRTGNCQEILQELLQETEADTVYWNRLYRHYCCQRDRLIKEKLNVDYSVVSFPGNVLIEPWELLTQAKTCFKVFTPFWKALTQKISKIPLLPLPKKILGYHKTLPSQALDSWDFPSSKIADYWQPGEHSAQQNWQAFLSHIDLYRTQRNFPSIEGTSRLSPHLHWGEISVRQLWQDIHSYQFSVHFSEEINFKSLSGSAVYLKELGWRDFFQYLLYHFPDMATQPLQKKFQHFQWNQDIDHDLKKWQQGLTGYPLIDAGMRQLAQSGWMHNRVRMVVASFLVKHLLIDWRQGERWFWENLVDADHASNIGNWQWIAGCGADAAPYFRIFNPVLQSKKFDAQGDYIRKWVPELEKLPTEYIHQPWKFPAQILTLYGVSLGKTYPYPLVEHEKARKVALGLYAHLKEIASSENPQEILEEED